MAENITLSSRQKNKQRNIYLEEALNCLSAPNLIMWLFFYFINVTGLNAPGDFFIYLNILF